MAWLILIFFSFFNSYSLFRGFSDSSPVPEILQARTLEWVAISFSVGKESAYSAGDPSLIPGSGRSAGEGIGYPLQYSWASLVAQLVNNLPEMQMVQFLGHEDPLEKRKATHSNILLLPWWLSW